MHDITPKEAQLPLLYQQQQQQQQQQKFYKIIQLNTK